MQLIHNHKLYVEPGSANWYRYFDSNQKGGGLDDYFTGLQYQRGAGLGNIFRGIISMAKPLIGPVAKRAVSKVARTGLETALNVAQDALQGQNVGQSLKQRATEAGADLLSAARSRLRNGGSSRRRRPRKGKQRRQIGRGLGMRNFSRKRPITIKGKAVAAKKRKKDKDIFE